MGALLLGSLLAVLGLLWVLVPLVQGADAHASSTAAPRALAREATALDALREIEFDQATGKLSPEDYETLRAEYTPLAVAELRAADAALALRQQPDASIDAAADPAEALIARAKARAVACTNCGPRPESDALFCSDCGETLAAWSC